MTFAGAASLMPRKSGLENHVATTGFCGAGEQSAAVAAGMPVKMRLLRDRRRRCPGHVRDEMPAAVLVMPLPKCALTARVGAETSITTCRYEFDAAAGTGSGLAPLTAAKLPRITALAEPEASVEGTSVSAISTDGHVTDKHSRSARPRLSATSACAI
jgi:hypothetical protein